MTGNNDCPHNRNIDCPYSGAVLFCQNCGFYPLENERRKHHLNKHLAEIETERQKNIIQLFIKHNKKRVSYTIRRVRKRTDSPKTDRQLNNEYSVAKLKLSSLYGTMLNNQQSDS